MSALPAGTNPLWQGGGGKFEKGREWSSLSQRYSFHVSTPAPSTKQLCPVSLWVWVKVEVGRKRLRAPQSQEGRGKGRVKETMGLALLLTLLSETTTGPLAQWNLTYEGERPDY